MRVQWGDTSRNTRGDRLTRHGFYWLAGVVVVLAIGTWLVVKPTADPTPTELSSTRIDTQQIRLKLAPVEEVAAISHGPVATTSPVEAPPPIEQWTTITVKPGDNLSLIFSRLNLSKRDLHEILALGKETKELKRLRPGQQIRFLLDEPDGFIELQHERDLRTTLHVTRKENSHFQSELIILEPDKKIATATATIDSSLFLAGQAANLSDGTIMEIASIFGWDIDFVLDIRRGDTFSLIYEQLYKDDERVGDGDILAAEFVNRGKIFRAVRYVGHNGGAGYYSDVGLNMRKAFLRAPVNFTRISSRFNLKRRHPVLNTIRAHKGVDYAAPHGTPVKATGDGKVISIGRNGGYGKSIVLQHGGIYSTVYAHLSRYARAMKKGKAIKQGQAIGYVGQTGLATGPHLHYEFRVNGAHRNPMTVELPQAAPIAREHRADFKEKSTNLLARLDELKDPTIAAAAIPAQPPVTKKPAQKLVSAPRATTIN
jgi:murein DD-endopeptidase MepM/ murein hydrolase activator NlpD